MEKFDNSTPNSHGASSTFRRRASLSARETRLAALRAASRNSGPVEHTVLPPPPEDSRELLRGVHLVMNHSLGGPLEPEAARMLADDETRSLLLLRSFAAMGHLGLAGEQLADAQERIARIRDTAAMVLEEAMRNEEGVA